MIRINLLPSGKKKALLIPPVFIYGAAVFILLIMITFISTIFLISRASAIKDEISIKEKRVNELKLVLKEVENYEKDNMEFRKKTTIIEQLKKNQIVPLRLLDEISEKLPQGVWLTNMTDRGGLVNIKGYAFTNSDLVSYVQNLKESKYFVDVTLEESRQENLDEYSVYKFSLVFKVKV
ncbi:MAG: PilN domain-containing protein [Nitrospirota bacterium]|nr:PilN domain-containing protein [Nitrospirota bacterium]